jgi:hypothetical protein
VDHLEIEGGHLTAEENEKHLREAGQQLLC